MKTQKLFSTLKSKPRVILRSIICLLVVVLGLYFGATENTFAQSPQEVSVEVGRIKSNRLRRQVNADSINITVNRPIVARAWFDEDSGRFRIEGLSVGTARIVFTGTYRKIIVGGTLEERAVPFRHVIDVTVLPRFIEADSRALRLQVSRGSNKTYKIEYLLGPQFARRSEEGVRWRNVRLIDGNASIAEGLYDNSLLKFRLMGINNGRTTLILKGERLNNRVWQTVIRRLEITVGTGIS
jgi:hypothetical protein